MLVVYSVLDCSIKFRNIKHAGRGCRADSQPSKRERASQGAADAVRKGALPAGCAPQNLIVGVEPANESWSSAPAASFIKERESYD